MLRTLNFVLEQSLDGHHHLFDPDLIRRAFAADGTFSGPIEQNTADQASDLLDELRRRLDLRDQQACIAEAPQQVQDVLVRLYFHYLDRFAARKGLVLH